MDKLVAQLLNLVLGLKSRKTSFVVAVILFLQVVFLGRLNTLDFFKGSPRLPILLGLTGLLFFYLCVVEDLFQAREKRLVAIPIVSLVFVSIFFLWSYHGRDPYLAGQIPLILLIGLLFHRSLFSMGDVATWEWQNAFSKTIIESALIGAVFAIAASLLVYLFEFVFEINAPPSVYEFFIKCGVTIIPSLVFLGRIGTVRASLRRFDIGIIKYLFVPLWAIYVLFLNVYALKILIHWSLPKGMVALPVSIAFIIYALIWWSPTPLKEGHDFSLVHFKAERVIRWMHITLLLLFWIAVVRRISDYGLTQPRYFLILLGIFFSSTVYLDVKRQLTGRWFSALLLVILFLSLIQVPNVGGEHPALDGDTTPTHLSPLQQTPP